MTIARNALANSVVSAPARGLAKAYCSSPPAKSAELELRSRCVVRCGALPRGCPLERGELFVSQVDNPASG